MSYRIRYTRSTNHIEGIPERTTGPATDNSATTGVVAYYAASACPSLTRSGYKMGVTGEDYTALADALADARTLGGRNLCKHCERAATKAITDTYEDTQWRAIEAAKRLDIATNTRNEQLIADAEDFAERMNDQYADAAEDAGRCRIFHCERPTHESSAWCEAHTVTDTADDYAARINAAYDKAEAANTHLSPTGQRLAAASAAHDEAMRIAHEGEGTSAQADADAVYEAARAAYRAASDNHRAAREAAEHEDADASAIEAETAARHEADDADRMTADTEHDASTCPARALGEPCEHCEPLFTALEDARVAYRKAVDDADGSHDHITLALADAALTAYQAAARAAAACLYYGCAAVVDDGSGWCHEHGPKTVRFVNDDYDPAVAAAGRASTIGKPYVPDASKWNGCEARIMHNGVGSPCGRPRGHEGPNGAVHRTTTGIEWMNGQTRPLYCPYARTSTGCEDCDSHAALVERLLGYGKATTYAEAEALAVAMEEEPEAFTPLADPEAVYNDARRQHRTASDRYEEHGGADNRAAERAAWDDFVAAARAAGKCIDFTCYAPAEFGSDHCQRHHKTVHAHLDHTEPGKAIVLITGGHGRDADPQAWLAHDGGSWLLVDDYDGDTLNVKGPDAERAVHAWAALLGLRLDGLAVAVEYAGGPVSPPVRAVERPGPVTLEWVSAGDNDGAPVFEAKGRAHTYRVTDHASGYTPLVATLRGANIETHRRSYDNPDNARKAAQNYETRYGTIYAPVE